MTLVLGRTAAPDRQGPRDRERMGAAFPRYRAVRRLAPRSPLAHVLTED